MAAFGFHANRAHHAAVFVLQNMTVIEECPDGVGVAKIHAQFHAGYTGLLPSQ